MFRYFVNLLCVTFLAGGLLISLGCGGKQQETSVSSTPESTQQSVPATSKKIKVAFITNNASDFWKIAEAGTKKAAQDFGVEVIFRIPSSGTAEQQQQILQDLITLGVAGVAISPKDPENQTEMLNEAAKKVNLITQDSDAPNSLRKCY